MDLISFNTRESSIYNSSRLVFGFASSTRLLMLVILNVDSVGGGLFCCFVTCNIALLSSMQYSFDQITCCIFLSYS